MVPGGRFFAFCNTPLIIAVCKIVVLFLLLGPQIGNAFFILFMMLCIFFTGTVHDAVILPLSAFPFGMVLCYFGGIVPALCTLIVWLFAWAIGHPFRTVWWYAASCAALVFVYAMFAHVRVFGTPFLAAVVVTASICHCLARGVYVRYRIRMAGVPVTKSVRAQL